MNFELSPTSSSWSSDTARDLATHEILPQAAEIDRSHDIPDGASSRAWASSACSASMVPEKWGGAGMDALSLRAGAGGDLARLRVDGGHR